MSTKTIAKRIQKQQEQFLEQCRKLPIIQVVCERSGISRATYYRWRKEFPDFSKEADQAIQEGKLLVNDMAESQLLNAIKDHNMTGIIFWLKHHHRDYATKVEISTAPKDKENLTKEQEDLVKKSLVMAGLIGERRQDEADRANE